jgi:ESX secretion-associated protein EspG
VTRFLTPVALDFVWESLAAGEPPYPLDVRSHGATMDERRAIRHRVWEDLRTQHMLDLDGRLSPDVEDWLTLLTHGTRSIDAVFEGTAALAVGDGTRALLATQNADGLTLRPIDPSALVSSVVALLPAHPRGKEHSISIPVAELRSPRSPMDREVMKALADRPKLRAGQLAANARNAMGGRSRAPVLSWFDTDEGRYLTYSSKGRDGTEWMTIAPADAATLRHRLTELLSSVSAGRQT